MAEVFGLDAYAPKQIAARVSELGVGKAKLPLLTLSLLGVLAALLYWVINLRTDGSRP
ncbi:hypothetical protein [Roseateles sp.]|uniref:hypothetical protein n=1 Tax=Roseateles sp. TaxID=1971397 RepID=UPI003BA5176C